jgi:hypothetical protein
MNDLLIGRSEGMKIVKRVKEVIPDKVPMLFEKCMAETVRSEVGNVIHRENYGSKLLHREMADEGGSLSGIQEGGGNKGEEVERV